MTTAALFELLQSQQRGNLRPIPPKQAAYNWINALLDALFPIRCADTALQSVFELKALEIGLMKLLLPLQKELSNTIEQVTHDFFAQIPTIYELLQADAQAILEYDPAAHSLEEVIAAYPGFYAIAVYRFSHQLYSQKVPILPRLIAEYAHSQTGIDINAGASIGKAFFIDHGTGIVIGETCIIGNHVKIYQGVTLGALSVRKSEANTQRHPTIEDNVTIYSGTTILGGNTVVGHDSVIGGNVWLTESVPAFSVVYHKSEVKVRSSKTINEVIDFVI